MFGPPGIGYDRGSTTFSPDGRIFQIEYAIEAVRNSNSIVGIKTSSAVVLAAQKDITNLLMDTESIRHIFLLDRHIGTATSGLLGDIRRIVDHSRLICHHEKIQYDEPIDLKVLVKRVSDFVQSHTQSTATRPFGASLLYAGLDGQELDLYSIDPSGHIQRWKAIVIGRGSQEGHNFIQKLYRQNADLHQTEKLAIKVIDHISRKTLGIEDLEMASIENLNRRFQYYSNKKIQRIFDSIKSK